MAIIIIVKSVFGLPWFVAATVLSINHIQSLTKESESSAPGEKPHFLGIREQGAKSIDHNLLEEGFESNLSAICHFEA